MLLENVFGSGHSTCCDAGAEWSDFWTFKDASRYEKNAGTSVSATGRVYIVRIRVKHFIKIQNNWL